MEHNGRRVTKQLGEIKTNSSHGVMESGGPQKELEVLCEKVKDKVGQFGHLTHTDGFLSRG